MTQSVKPLFPLMLSLAASFALSTMMWLPSDALAQGLNNPLNRNPQDRSSVPDTASVTQDLRNSSTRPTQPAAPSEPDPRNADRSVRDPSRFTRIAPVGAGQGDAGTPSSISTSPPAEAVPALPSTPPAAVPAAPASSQS